jgi:predicted PurR-regulated permease PerM
MNDNILLLIFSLPYLYDFIVGIITLFFMSRIAHFNETLKEIMRDENEEDRKRFLESKANTIQNKFSGQNLNELLEKRRNAK